MHSKRRSSSSNLRKQRRSFLSPVQAQRGVLNSRVDPSVVGTNNAYILIGTVGEHFRQMGRGGMARAGTGVPRGRPRMAGETRAIASVREPCLSSFCQRFHEFSQQSLRDKDDLIQVRGVGATHHSSICTRLLVGAKQSNLSGVVSLPRRDYSPPQRDSRTDH